MRADLFYTAMLAFAFGILLETFLVFSFATIVWFLFLGLVLALLWRSQSRAPASRMVLIASIALVMFALGATRLYLAEQTFKASPFTPMAGTDVTVEGVVVREPDVRERSTQLFVRIEDELLLVRTERYSGISYGDLVTVAGLLEVPEPFETDLGRSFNYPGYLKAQGATHLVSFAEVEVLSHSEGNPVVEKLLAFKHGFMEQIELVLPEPHAGLAEGLLLGVKSGLGDELESSFRTTGIIHIVVLSGYNVMLVVAFVLYGLAFVLPFRGRLLIGLLAIATFAVLVGLSATVVRASVMAGLLLLARFLGRTYAILRGLAIAAVAMLLVNPYLLAYDVGFQLSFVATLGLILLAPWIQARLERVPTWLGAREFLTATLAAQLFVTPLLLYQIGQLSVVSVLVNVLVLPMVPVSMLLTFATGLAAFLSVPFATALAYPTYLSLSYIITVAERFANIPFAAYDVPVFPLYVVVLAYAGLGYMAYKLYGAGEAAAPELIPKLPMETEDLSNWTMVDEVMLRSELRGQLKTGSVRERTEPVNPAEVPIFFR